MRTGPTSPRGIRWAALAGLIAALTLAACGSSGSSSSSTAKTSSSAAATSSSAAATSSSAAATRSTTSSAVAPSGGSAAAQIKRNWIRFFNGSTPAQTKIPLLQNGQQYAKVLQTQAQNPLAQQAKATVSKVQVISPTKAKVTYTVLVAGKPALAHRSGEALKSGGVWRVSDASFCQLLALEGGAPSICPKG